MVGVAFGLGPSCKIETNRNGVLSFFKTDVAKWGFSYLFVFLFSDSSFTHAW